MPDAARHDKPTRCVSCYALCNMTMSLLGHRSWGLAVLGKLGLRPGEAEATMKVAYGEMHGIKMMRFVACEECAEKAGLYVTGPEDGDRVFTEPGVGGSYRRNAVLPPVINDFEKPRTDKSRRLWPLV